MKPLFLLRFQLLSAILPLIFLISCTGDDKPNRSVFLWKSKQVLEKTDRNRIRALGITHFFVRYADVHWNPIYQIVEPVAGSDPEYFSRIPYQITPVFFITNDVLVNSNNDNLLKLASNIASLYYGIHHEFAENYADALYYQFGNYSNNVERPLFFCNIDSMAKRWQNRNHSLLIDCDWTVSTQEKYFSLLSEIAKLLPDIEVQSSLRLWQYRDYKLSGVPPVDRCLLMCYSTGDPANPDEHNAIVDYQTIQEYINHSHYPLELDIALPVYSWATLFRNRKLVGIISPMSLKELVADSSTYSRIDSTHFTVKLDTVMGNTYYRYGDEVCYQGIEANELMKISEWVDRMIDPSSNDKISLFSYDTLYFNQIGNENIKKVFRIFD
jgi:hypothetical protein